MANQHVHTERVRRDQGLGLVIGFVRGNSHDPCRWRRGGVLPCSGCAAGDPQLWLRYQYHPTASGQERRGGVDEQCARSEFRSYLSAPGRVACARSVPEVRNGQRTGPWEYADHDRPSLPSQPSITLTTDHSRRRVTDLLTRTSGQDGCTETSTSASADGWIAPSVVNQPRAVIFLGFL